MSYYCYCNNNIIVNKLQEYKCYRDLSTNEQLNDGTVRKLKLNVNLNLGKEGDFTASMCTNPLIDTLKYDMKDMSVMHGKEQQSQ